MIEKKEKIIITGGTGYIGSHTALEFIDQRFEVVLVDNLSNSDSTVVDKISALSGVEPTFENIDLTNSQKTASFFKEHNDAKGVINFAALKAVGESVQMPISYYRNNLVVLLNILENMDLHGISNLIFSSSATVYGLPKVLPITENEETKRPTSPYGNTKKVAEEIIHDFTLISSAFKAVSLRYFNPIGAHHSGQLGEAPTGIPNNLMPYITQTAAGERKELKVFGKDYETKDGTAIRDYLHVVDLAKAHVSAFNRLQNQDTKSNFEIFNLGTGIGYSVLDVIKSFEKTSGKKLNYSFDKRRVGDVPQLYADPSKATEKLGWKATLSLDDMTSSSWNWEKNLRIKAERK